MAEEVYPSSAIFMGYSGSANRWLFTCSYYFFTSGTISGRSLSSQPTGRFELYQAIEPMVVAAIKPTIATVVSDKVYGADSDMASINMLI